MYVFIAAIFIVISTLTPASSQLCTDLDKDGYYAEGGQCGEADCDDGDPRIHPGAVEICDGRDSDCDGWKPPADTDRDGDGTPLCASDCNDEDPLTYPGAVELCDGKDNDCNWFVPFNEIDHDSDGYLICDEISDCNDFNAAINPGTPEIPADGIDNNCDGLIDTELPATCVDADLDGFVDISCGGADCDDSNPAIYPGAAEICDAQDSNCDGFIPWNERDADGDGYSVCNGDCDDSNANVYPVIGENCSISFNDCTTQARLTWTAPETSADGSPLTDLAGYIIHFGTYGNDYNVSIDAGSNTCYALHNLPPGRWCFAVTAYDTSGNESGLSNEGCADIAQKGNVP